jgi:hypothetical protein
MNLGTQYPNNLNEPSRFEAFVNYVLLRQLTSDSVEPDDLVFPGDDPGIDGFFIVVGEALISTREELEEAFKNRHRDVEVEVIMSQAKTGESWNKHEINTFSVAIGDILSENPKFPLSEKLRERRDLFFGLFDYVGLISGGRPKISASFVTTARKAAERELTAAVENIKSMLEQYGYFSAVSAELVDRDQLNTLWLSASGSTEARIRTIGIAPFPEAPGISASYVVTVSARDFIDNILTSDDGKLRQRIFDENVRDYIGDDNEVNNEIAATISDPEKQRRFGVMNNGVTIVSPDVRVQGVDIFLKDFQIVNGCQTSNVLFFNRAHIGPEANLVVKIVHARETTFVEDIVRSTNRQSKVQDEQFLATIETIKNIERYFDARDDGEDQKLYFERRKNQYAGRGIPAIRIFDVKQLARCVGAMFIERPDLATRYPNKLTGELKGSVFEPKYQEEIYYTSALAYYRIFLHFSNQRIDQKFSNLKWHLLMALKVYLDDGEGAHLSSQKVKKLCGKINYITKSNRDADIAILKNLCIAISND